MLFIYICLKNVFYLQIIIYTKQLMFFFIYRIPIYDLHYCYYFSIIIKYILIHLLVVEEI